MLPELAFADVTWNGVAAGAVRRALKQRLAIGTAVAVACLPVLTWWTLVLIPLLVLWAVVDARRYVEALGWSTEPHQVLFRSGWLWRQICIARFTKMQAVGLHESPFDRRAAMARVRVDTAGARSGSGIDIPYLPRATAQHLYEALGTAAARTEFRW